MKSASPDNTLSILSSILLALQPSRLAASNSLPLLLITANAGESAPAFVFEPASGLSNRKISATLIPSEFKIHWNRWNV